MRWLLLVGMLAATVSSYMVGPAKGFMEPDLFRIVFFHLPCAFVATIYFFVGAFHSLKALKGKGLAQLEADVRAVTANEMALLMSVLTMVTGILFSKVQWGGWWAWDPRQTSFLLVLLIYGAYFALRSAFSDEQQRARIAASYAALSLLPALFLIFVLPRLMESLHPNDTVSGGKMDRQYWLVILPIFALLMVTCVILHRLAIRAGLLDLKSRHGNLEANLDDSAPASVVRSVSVPSPGGSEDQTN